MSEETFNPDEFNCKIDILFGSNGEHHLMLAGPSQLGITSFVHALTHDEDMGISILYGLFSEVPDSVVVEKLQTLPIEAAMRFVSGYPVKNYSTVITGMVMTETDEVGETGGTKYEAEEVSVGMKFTFSTENNTLADVSMDVIRLWTEHRLFNALVQAYTGRDEDEINAVLVEHEGK